MSDLEVRIESGKPRYAFGEAVSLEYTLNNVSEQILFVVKDESRIYAIKESDQALRVVMGQIKPTIEMDYFEFRPPELYRLPPGAELSSTLSIGMPLQETMIGIDGQVSLIEIDLSGEFKVRLEVGYGSEGFRPASLDALGDFLAWQRLAVSSPVTLHVAARGPTAPVSA